MEEVEAPMQRAAKLKRRLTVHDISAISGKTVEEVEAEIEQRHLEKEVNQENQDSPDVDVEDLFGDDSFADAPMASTRASHTAVREEVRVLKSKVRSLEYTVVEVVSDLYRSTIRVLAKPRINGKKFEEGHKKVGKGSREEPQHQQH